MRPAWRKVASGVFIAAALGFLGAAVYRNLEELRGFAWEVRPVLLVLSIAAHIAVLLWGVRVWQLLLRRFAVRIPFRTLARIWFLSGIARYIPGKVWQFIGVAHLGSAVGLHPMTGITSLAVQMGMSLLGAGMAAVYFLPLGVVDTLAPAAGDTAARVVVLLRWAAPLGILFVHPGVIGAALALFRRFAKRATVEWSGGWADGIWLLALSTVGWVLYGGAFYLFLASLVPLPVSALPAVTAMNALAFIVGYVIFVAPAGVGPKEGALTALLTALVPLPVAAVLAIAARLWTVAAEVIPALLLLRGARGSVEPPAGAAPTAVSRAAEQ
ncbi:hypothetical protein BH23GEM3_BH23GEM3_24180 [soil metagenome]